MIKLLALDLDGTLLSSNGTISPENFAAIQKAEKQGVLVTIATGRRFRDARPVGLEIELNAPLICHNGALLKCVESLETVDFSTLNNQTLHDILRIGTEFGADAMLSCDPHGKGILYYDRVSEENIPLQGYINWSKRLHGDEANEAIHHVEDLREILSANETVHASFSGTCEPMRELRRVLESELNSTANIMATIYPHLDFTLLDILPFGASKGIAVEKLAQMNQLSSENVMVIGDNFNDLEMLNYAGTSVVMGNASPELLENEKFETTLSNDENGVALAIEKFILNRN
jgi:Cof subfamily protein (haloacid dehalogenase superfamily)